MRRFFINSLIAITLILSSCGKTSNFPMDTPHWGSAEYDRALSELRVNTLVDEKYPTLNNPETSPIFLKLIDRENITVVADDAALGTRFKAKFMSDMFDRYREMIDLYGDKMDREDKFVYDAELAEILKFGLFLQVHYFKLGNDEVLAAADKKESAQKTITDNERIIVKNFNHFLDYVNYEKSFSEGALNIYAIGIKEEFDFLIATFPTAPYDITLAKAEAMEAKATNKNLKLYLGNLVAKLKTKTESAVVPNP